ncbi:MAG: hypothetical protein MUE52_00390 [Tabrizicola sp.]|nr:hypothetical protein [Tabrizicola sp.]
MVSIESVLWLTFLVAASVMVGQTVVSPLVANAQTQAQLNLQSVAIIEQALAVCPMEVSQ